MKGQEQTVTVDQIVYRLKPNGKAMVEHDMGWPDSGRIIELPESVQGHTVVSIADNAFSHHERIRSLFIPATVTWIGKNALPRGRWEEVIIGYQEEYGWNRKGSFPMYGNEIVPIVRVVAGSYAETWCKEHDIKYTTENGH